MTLESVKHGKFSMAFMPVDIQWRKLRRILKEQMFSLQRLDASQGIREEKLHKLYEYVNQCRVNGHAVDIAEATFTTSLNTISSTLFSVDFADFNSDSSQEFKDVVWNVSKCIGSPNLADYFPVLKYVDLQGISRRTKFYFGKLYAILDSIIDQRLKSKGTLEKNDLLEALLDLYQKPEPELSRNEIKHILMDLFLGSTDTVPSTVEWAMAELLRNPKKMSKAKSELSDVIGEHGVIQESDISKLSYLQAVVKEIHRLHPVAPLLVPHKAEADVEINGYIIPKKAQILVNTWASSRDSNIWSSPDSFMPERFLDCKIDYNGQDFKFIPFGSGRRMCPGLALAHRVVHVMLATLIHNFDWRLEEGLKPEEIDMSEKFTTTLHKAIPLKAIPIKF
ncbi:unnamed protein product [Fraxinus pennsylvanica]|uniref:Cytochrome P450 n=1 Tax=Fraxinus pennsylvanica TaxID=56036 RepID=A0AAD1ZIV4_9LAMI|nr:unnamed protein product [Fraxinus pennsylvanica]